MAQAVNVAKYNSGGSGNYISDGYIKTIEKVWLDSYTIAFTNTNTTIDIAAIPANKRITSIDVEIYTEASQSSGTISIGFNTDASVDTLLAPVTLASDVTRTSIALPGPGIIECPTLTSTTITPGVLAGFQKVTSGSQTTVAIKLNNWTMTTGTIKTVVRYT